MRRKGKEWERKGHTTYVSGEFRAHPEASHKTPTTEFCKTAATATTLFAETAMDRAFQGVVAPPFFIQKKGCCHHVRKRGKKQAEEDHTPEKGDGYEHAETGNRTGNAKPTEGQDTGCGLTRPRLQPDNTTVAARQYQSYHPAELQFQPDGTKVTILMKL